MLGRAIFCWMVSVGLAAAATFEVAQPPQPGEAYQSAQFRLWVPDGGKPLRALLIRQHGCGRAGVDHADDVQWQALARKYDAALLGSHFVQNKECVDWFDPTRGSERALLAALQHFATESKHPELTTIPWALWGHSGGSLWALNLTYRHADRTLAVFGRSQATLGGDGRVNGIPILLNYGEQEKTGRFASVHTNSQQLFNAKRAGGAFIAVSIDPKASHDCRNARHLAIPFFDAVLAQRLPAAGQTALKPMNDGLAWLGNPDTLAISSAAQYAGDKTKACWLPDETTARRWQEFGKTGSVTDLTPPAPVAGLLAKKTTEGVSLSWSAVADLDTGIKHFAIYRDGKKIGTLGGTITKANPAGHYQIWNYGDEPEPKPAALVFVDKLGTPTSKYEVTVVNHADLESGKPPAVIVSP